MNYVDLHSDFSFCVKSMIDFCNIKVDNVNSYDVNSVLLVLYAESFNDDRGLQYFLASHKADFRLVKPV